MPALHGVEEGDLEEPLVEDGHGGEERWSE
jgi:hypothetical protein